MSLLSKIEIGDRTLTPGNAAAIARALQISLGALYGEAEISVDQGALVKDLRTAVRRYDIPDQAPMPDPAQLRIDLDHARTLREQTDLTRLLRMLPGLLTRATTHAHAVAACPPDSGSVTAIVGRQSPEAMAGSHCFFCSSLPKWTILATPSCDAWTMAPMAPLTRASPSMITVLARWPIPMPPYLSGRVTPIHP